MQGIAVAVALSSRVKRVAGVDQVLRVSHSYPVRVLASLTLSFQPCRYRWQSR